MLRHLPAVRAGLPGMCLLCLPAAVHARCNLYAGWSAFSFAAVGVRHAKAQKSAWHVCSARPYGLMCSVLLPLLPHICVAQEESAVDRALREHEAEDPTDYLARSGSGRRGSGMGYDSMRRSMMRSSSANDNGGAGRVGRHSNGGEEDMGRGAVGEIRLEEEDVGWASKVAGLRGMSMGRDSSASRGWDMVDRRAAEAGPYNEEGSELQGAARRERTSEPFSLQGRKAHSRRAQY